MTAPSMAEGRDGYLWGLVDEVLARRRLILASNRGPVEHHIGPDGQLQARRGSGAVVTALNSLTTYRDFSWVASAMGDGDRRAAEAHEGGVIRSPVPGHRVSVRYVVTPRRVYHKYYNVLCNPLLWFLQHYMWSSSYTPNVDALVHDAWENGYVTVNRAFAQAIVEEARANGATNPCIMVHDYHLYLVPGYVRAELPDALVHQFIHIPWPTASYWQLLPAAMCRAICSSLTAADIVGFQTTRDVRSFLDSCEAFLPEAKVDHDNCRVMHKGRQTLVRAYPISIDVEEVRRIATSSRAQEYERRLRPLLGEKTIIRVDRAEPSKNILRGFRAYDALLQRYPDLRGKVKFLAFLVPSRTNIRQYQRYISEIDGMVQSINSSYGTADWQPVTTFYENNYTQAIAGMRLYDVLLTNSVIDGMNLVAKEGPVVNTRDGVLVISEGAGAHEQLCCGSLCVAPADIEGTTQALYNALVMSPEERKERSARLVESIEREDVARWLYRQFQDIHAAAS